MVILFSPMRLHTAKQIRRFAGEETLTYAKNLGYIAFNGKVWYLTEKGRKYHMRARR